MSETASWTMSTAFWCDKKDAVASHVGYRDKRGGGNALRAGLISREARNGNAKSDCMSTFCATSVTCPIRRAAAARLQWPYLQLVNVRGNRSFFVIQRVTVGHTFAYNGI